MPLYFAYGANMDRETMRRCCPKSRPLGRARLARHRFFIMSSGHGSVKRDARMDVHGVVYDLAFADIPALGRCGELGHGLYQKISQPVLRDGAAPVRALLHVGVSAREGVAQAAYLETMIAAAGDWDFPDSYCSYLRALAGRTAMDNRGKASGWHGIRLKGV